LIDRLIEMPWLSECTAARIRKSFPREQHIVLSHRDGSLLRVTFTPCP